MIDFWFPRWLKTILRKYPNNRKIADVDMEEIRKNLKKFEVESPLVSIVIPAWNEEENIIKTIASLALNEFDFACDLFVVNNNSTDNTQAVLDNIGVRSMLETNQGIAPARRRGLLESRGKYHLCCDSDTVYPASWIKCMTEAIQKNEKDGVACIYGSYSFIPHKGKSRFVMALYETASSVIRSFKSKETETRRVMGFNFGLNREIALQVNGFIMEKTRKFRNELGSADYVGNSEDGMMAFDIKKSGYKIMYVNSRKSRVWTSDQRMQIEGGLLRASLLRVIKIINRKAFDKIAEAKQ